MGCLRDCAELIDRDAWSSLTERALQCFAREHAVARYDLPAVREQLREIHQLFRQHMIREYSCSSAYPPVSTLRCSDGMRASVVVRS